MESTHTVVSLITILCVYIIYWMRRRKSSVVTDWPAIGMLPGLLLNAYRINDFFTELLEQGGGTFLLKGPFFANVDFLLTCDPANVHYVLSKNFSNFSKGPDFNTFFDDVLGGGIFNAVAKSWEDQRKTTMAMLNHHAFQNFVATTSWNKVETGLLPILGHMADQGTEVDLQDLFKRFTFDTTSILVLGHDPASLSTHLPHTEFIQALTDAAECIFYRHILPEFCWKLQRWVQFGREKKLRKATETFNQFLAQFISLKRQQHEEDQVATATDLLSCYMKLMSISGGAPFDTTTSINASEKLLTDILLNMMFAGTDTLSSALTWFFWLLARNPSKEIKIRQEIETSTFMNNTSTSTSSTIFTLKEVIRGHQLIYLHGALCETLRLFPPVPLQHKASIERDILPSGHDVDKNSKALLCFYSMGRMESIWGKDCLEFKPERWISETGRLKHEPSFKFPAFNAGPRSCVGKEVSFLQLKIVSAAVLRHYTINLVKGHPISPRDSVILHMKHGLKVRITKIPA